MVAGGEALRAKIDFDPNHCRDISQVSDAWLPLALAMNCINRSIGQRDFYPLVLSLRVLAISAIWSMPRENSSIAHSRIRGTLLVGLRLKGELPHRDRHKRKEDYG
jgi:Putative zinc-binding metallo-peptidase